MDWKRKRLLFFLLTFSLVSLSLILSALQNLKFETRKKAAELSAAAIPPGKYPILVIDLFIDRIKGKVEVQSIQKGFGFAPDYKNPNALDFLKAEIDTQRGEKREFFIPLPLKIVCAPPREGEEAPPCPADKLEKFSYPVILPFEEESRLLLKKTFEIDEKTIRSLVSFEIPQYQERTIESIIDGQPRDFQLQGLTLEGAVPDFQVEMVFDGDYSNQDPLSTLDIVFFSSMFSESEFETFRDFVKRQADALIGFDSFSGKEPFPSHRNVIKVRQVVSSTTLTHAQAVKIMAALGIPFDQYAIVINKDGRSSASLGGMGMSLFIRFGGGPERPLLFAHELGHSFGALLDEYVECDDYCLGDLWNHERNCKEDPSEPWVANQPGGAYLGCELRWSHYRPERTSIMNVIQEEEEFNAPSRFLLEEAFSAYTEAGLALFISPNRMRFYRDLSVPPEEKYPGYGSIYIYNLGLAQVSFRGDFSPQVDWIVNPQLEGITNRDHITFEIDSSDVDVAGKYETDLIIEFLTDPVVTKTVPITLLVGDSRTVPSLSWASPTEGSVFNDGDKIPLAIDSQITSPGWKRIEFYRDSFYKSEQLVYSRTLEPFTGVWDTTTYGQYAYPGTYYLWAKGIPFLGEPVETEKVQVELKAAPGTICEEQYSYKICYDQKISRECYRGAQDCQAKGLPYCCPVSALTPTPPSVCPDRGEGNLSCDYQLFIDETDLSILLTNWTTNKGDLNDDEKTDAADLNVLLSGWRPYGETLINPVDWQTDSVALQADDFYMIINGQKYVDSFGEIEIKSSSSENYTELNLTWREHNREMRFLIYFSNDGGQWWSPEIRTYDGQEQWPDWIYYYPESQGGFFRSELGEVFTAPELIIYSDPNQQFSGMIYFKNLQIQSFLK